MEIDPKVADLIFKESYYKIEDFLKIAESEKIEVRPSNG